MPVSFSPRPSDGPLNGQAPNVAITVTVTTAVGSVVGVLKIPGRGTIEIRSQTLANGRTKIVIPLPPGGAPKGAQLVLVGADTTGQESIAVYNFR